MEIYLKNYSWKNSDLLKYIKFKIDFTLISWRIWENYTKNLKTFKNEKNWIEFSYKEKKEFKKSDFKNEKEILEKAKNLEDFYYIIDNDRDSWLSYVSWKNLDIGFSISMFSGTYLDVNDFKNELIKEWDFTEKELTEIDFSWKKFYKYLDKIETKNNLNKFKKDIKVYNYFTWIWTEIYGFKVILDEKHISEVEEILKTVKFLKNTKKVWKKEFKSEKNLFKISFLDEKTITSKENDFWISLKKRWAWDVYSLNIIKKDLPKEFKTYDEYIDFTKQRYSWKFEIEEKIINSKKFLKIFLWEKQNFQKYNYLINWKNNFYFEIEISYLKGYENEVLEILKSFEILD